MQDSSKKVSRLPLPKINLVAEPTPLYRLDSISQQYDFPVWVKRDDLTGQGMGGNKIRKLEYILADAQKKGATTLVTGGGWQSNHAASLAICARKAGLRSALALVSGGEEKSEHYVHGGNMLLDRLSGAQIMPFTPGSDVNASIEKLSALVTETEGVEPYSVVMGGSDPIGAMGYVDAALEIAEQLKGQSVNIDTIIHASGSAGTQAGLIVGSVLADLDVRVLGLSILHEQSVLRELVLNLCEELAIILGLKGINWDEKIHIDDRFIGEGYGIASKETWLAIQKLITSEALVFDPTYSGKAAEGLLHFLDKEPIELGRGVLFIHTGGSPGLFAAADASKI